MGICELKRERKEDKEKGNKEIRKNITILKGIKEMGDNLEYFQ